MTNSSRVREVVDSEIEVVGEFERAGADVAGGDGVRHARDRAAMNAPAIRVRAFTDFQDPAAPGLSISCAVRSVFGILLYLPSQGWRPGQTPS